VQESSSDNSQLSSWKSIADFDEVTLVATRRNLPVRLDRFTAAHILRAAFLLSMSTSSTSTSLGSRTWITGLAAGRPGRVREAESGSETVMHWMPAAMMIGPMAATLGVSFAFILPPAKWRRGSGWSTARRRSQSHKKPTPVMGGVAFVLAIVLVFALSVIFQADWLADESVRHLAMSLGASALCFCFLGACDDRWPLTPRVKLIGQILSSLPFVSLNGSVETIGFLGWELPLGPVGGPITVLWLSAAPMW